MKSKKNLEIKKMKISQLSSIRGGHLDNPFRDLNKKASQQLAPGGDGCYSDTPTSCVYCV